MELKDKKINFLGDSITEGAHATDFAKKGYVGVIAEKTGAVCRNYGISGTRIARQSVVDPEKRADRDFCSRYTEMDKDADIVVIFGGTNDFGHGDAPLGTFEDTDPSTFCGALNHLYSGLKERFGGSRIVILTPLHRMEQESINGDGAKPQGGPVLSVYVELIRTAAEKFGFEILDFFASDEMDPRNPEDFKTYFADWCHPNDFGHSVLADKIIEFLSK